MNEDLIDFKKASISEKITVISIISTTLSLIYKASFLYYINASWYLTSLNLQTILLGSFQILVGIVIGVILGKYFGEKIREKLKMLSYKKALSKLSVILVVIVVITYEVNFNETLSIANTIFIMVFFTVINKKDTKESKNKIKEIIAISGLIILITIVGGISKGQKIEKEQTKLKVVTTKENQQWKLIEVNGDNALCINKEKEIKIFLIRDLTIKS